jgi:hypothetical protein
MERNSWVMGRDRRIGGRGFPNIYGKCGSVLSENK